MKMYQGIYSRCRNHKQFTIYVRYLRYVFNCKALFKHLVKKRGMFKETLLVTIRKNDTVNFKIGKHYLQSGLFWAISVKSAMKYGKWGSSNHKLCSSMKLTQTPGYAQFSKEVLDQHRRWLGSTKNIICDPKLWLACCKNRSSIYWSPLLLQKNQKFNHRLSLRSLTSH